MIVYSGACTAVMQNSECIMQNDCVGIAEGNTFILHSTFCILHFGVYADKRSFMGNGKKVHI